MVRWVIFLVLASLVYVGIFSKRGWLDYQRMVTMNQELAEKIDQSRKQKELLEHQIRAISADPSEQERMVRHVLGYVRPDETVIEFQ